MTDLQVLFWVMTAPYFLIAALYMVAWYEAIRAYEERGEAA